MKRTGKHRLLFKTLMILCLVIPSFPLLSCGAPSGDTSSPGAIHDSDAARLVSGIIRADSIEERKKAIDDVVKKGYSLGLLDENGNQLNENVADDAVSLTPEDIAAFAAFVDDGRYNTVGNVVEYLAEVGVVLAETGEIITTEGFLPDLQEYVDWSFAHSDDPDSQLGVLLASGPGMEPPTAAPQVAADTQISPIAAVLMLGDILIGKPESDTTVGNPFVKKAYADEIQQTAERIQGLITKIDSTLSSETVQLSTDFLFKLGKTVGFVDKETKKPDKIEIPPLAKKIIGAFALGNHFAVRVRESPSEGWFKENWPVIKSVELDSTDPYAYVGINPVLVLAPGSSSSGQPMEVMKTIPVAYTARLLSQYEAGEGKDLFPDANAVMVAINTSSNSSANQHVLTTASDENALAGFKLQATKLENDASRVALLHVSAIIRTGDLPTQFEKYKQEYGTAIKVLGLSPEDLADMFDVMKVAVKVSPWMAEVIFTSRKVTISPETFTGEPDAKCTFTASVNSWKDGSSWDWSGTREYGSIVETIDIQDIPEEHSKNNDQLYMDFDETGIYKITAKLLNGGKIIAEATAEATITKKIAPLQIEITGADTTGPDEPLVQGKEYTFIARTSTPEKLPDNPVYVWYFPDGTQEMPFTNEVTWAFPDTGNYLVAVDVFNADITTKPLQSTSIDVKVVASEEPETDVLKHLQDMKYFDVDFAIHGTLGNGNGRSYSFGLDDYGAEVAWDGVNFYVSWDYYSRSGTVTGQVSPDGSQIVQMTLIYNWDLTEDSGWYQLEIAGLPLWEDNYNDMFNQRVDDEDVQQYVASFTTHESFTADWDGDVLLNIYFAKTPF